MTGTDGLIALLEQPGAGNPGVRQVTQALRRTPQQVADQFDHWETIVDAVGAEQAADIVVNAARAAHKGWLAG
jgi:hypothetical protein